MQKMGWRKYVPSWLGGGNTKTKKPVAVKTVAAPQVVPAGEAPRQDGLVYGRIVRVGNDGVAIKLDEPYAFRPTGKKGVGFRGVAIGDGKYDGVVVGIPRKTVEAYCEAHYDEQLARLEAKKGGARAESPMENRLEGAVLEDLAHGKAVAKKAN
jgi:hypothetical protein